MADFPILDDRILRRLTEGSVADETGMEKRRFGGALAVKAPGMAWKNGVYNFGHDDLTHLNDILAFYAADSLTARFYLLPMGFTAELGHALTAAGYYQSSFQQAILYGVPLEEPPPCPDGISIESVTEATIDEFAEANVAGFEYPESWRGGIKAGLRADLGEAGKHLFLARFQEKPAGSAILTVRDGIGSLGGGSVVPEFRRKGCQLALIRHRMHAAHTLACNLIVSGANFGSPSFRNQQSAGLRLAFIESGWEKL